MAFDFPNSPTNGQTYTPAGGPTYTYDSAGTKWTVASIAAPIPITTGVYVPTHALGSNAAAATMYNTLYTRLSDRVIVSGHADVDPTAGGAVTTSIGISLPVASNLTGTMDLSGVMTAPGFTETGTIIGDITNDQALLTFQSATANNHQIAFVFQYKVQ
jgi:hypothetical protein